MANNAWWSLTACVAWILSRDSSAVDALNKPLPAVDKLAAHIRLSRLNNRPIKNARRELTDGVAKEKLMARGYNTVTKRR
jgi:hypothetical protein